MDQIALEQEMVDGGRNQVIGHLRRNEDSGQAYNNPYAQAIYRRYVLPMAEILTEYLAEVKRGVQAQAKGLLREHDPLVLAFITVRHAIGAASQSERVTFASLAEQIGKTVYGETLLARFESINPELYYTLVHDFERRMSKSERHRLTVFKLQAKKNNIALPQWSNADCVGIGTVLLGVAKELGLVAVEQVYERNKKRLLIQLHPEVAGIVDQISDFVAGASPHTLPCVAPPRPWTSPNDGGYHTTGMQRNAPCCVRGRPSVDVGDVPPPVLAALNRLQRDAWRINGRILDTVDEVSRHFDVGEVLAQAEYPKPDRPEWLTEDMNKEDMTEYQLSDFARWRSEVREWHTLRRVQGVKWGRFYEALRVARKFREETIYFVYQMDYRGRFYANTRGVSPQGSDLQKALLMAATPARLDSPLAQYWFTIAGANRFGFDKAPLDDRIQWVKDRHDMILACADDPINNRQWTEADCPFQFIAWCFEYAEWQEYGDDFYTRLPLGQDGSCNGLQHFSAMLRDELGGLATNLVPGLEQQDIYRLVAEETARIVAADPDDDEEGIAKRWRAHMLTRHLVKRSVMTLPYGSTRFSCADFIKKEYLQEGKAPEFAKDEYPAAANWLSFRVWEAIGNVVVKAREAMEWLQKASDELVEAGCDEITWVSPSGLLVRQLYRKMEVVKIETRLIGGLRIRPSVASWSGEVDKRQQRNGIAPNFVHSCDAAHMHLLINAADRAGIGHLAFIHDDYGALAPDIPKLHELIRSTFVDMYQSYDPLLAFKDRHGILKEIPKSGSLDITKVKDSVYFFI